MRKNERKIIILRILYETVKSVSAKQIHEKMRDKISIENIRALLLRYFGYGWIHREKRNGTFRYKLNKTGLNKLIYLKKIKELQF